MYIDFKNTNIYNCKLMNSSKHFHLSVSKLYISSNDRINESLKELTSVSLQDLIADVAKLMSSLRGL